jgi:hypothetical protein
MLGCQLGDADFLEVLLLVGVLKPVAFIPFAENILK